MLKYRLPDGNHQHCQVEQYWCCHCVKRCRHKLSPWQGSSLSTTYLYAVLQGAGRSSFAPCLVFATASTHLLHLQMQSTHTLYLRHALGAASARLTC